MLAVYTKDNCGGCTSTKMWLERRGIPYTERNIMEDPEYIETLKALGFMQAPVVVPADDNVEPWSGYRPDLLALYA